MEKIINLILNKRLPLLAWLVLPILVMWLLIGYLVGNQKKPEWATEKISSSYLAQNNSSVEKKPSEFTWTGEGLVTIWFDDAWLSQYTVAYPILEKYQKKAAISVATDSVGEKDYMSWAQVKRLQSVGWEVISHGRNHNCDPELFDEKKLTEELLGSKEDLLNNNLLVESFVAPCGLETDQLIDEVKKYYISQRTSGPGINSLPIEEPYRLTVEVIHPYTKLVDISEQLSRTKETKGWLILVIHQVDTQNLEYSASPTQLKEIIETIEEFGLEVVLPTQALHLSVI